MLQPVSVGLKFGFLIVLFLFLFWVATSAMFDLRRRSHGGGGGRGQFNGGSDETGWYSAEALADLDEDFEPRLLVEHARGHSPGLAYDLIDGATLGRGDVEIRLDDPFASSRHARISRHGRTLVIEDLGSTNGTYLNEEALNGPQPLHDGDRIKIGDSEFSYYE